jgi:uncharacterized protein YbgA (DUF1722 family)/uncharacterized protein YbbK (DUF523 family)
MSCEELKNIKLGVSACLMGEKVRYDGGHKHDRYLTDILGNYFEWISVCPELDVGMGVPRESVRLSGSGDQPRMVGIKSRVDWTDRMNRYAKGKADQLAKFRLCGYVLKKDSPSCGMERVRIYGESGTPSKNGRGLFADAIKIRLPLIPIEEEGRLNDPAIRDNFIVRVFAYHRLQNLFEGKFDRGALVRFHTAHKLLLMAHSPKHYQTSGKLVADAKQYDSVELRDKYSKLFMEALSVKTSVKKNVNVLHHIIGYLRPHLNEFEKIDILEIIEDYHQEFVPLVVPITLIGHYVRKHDIKYILDQVYLKPHPKELMLRNHV